MTLNQVPGFFSAQNKTAEKTTFTHLRDAIRPVVERSGPTIPANIVSLFVGFRDRLRMVDALNKHDQFALTPVSFGKRHLECLFTNPGDGKTYRLIITQTAG